MNWLTDEQPSPMHLPGYQSAISAHSWSYEHEPSGRLKEWKDGNGSVVASTRETLLNGHSLRRPVRRALTAMGVQPLSLMVL